MRTDVFSKAKRSEVMSRIRGRGNKDTELALMRVFRAYRITGWRRRQAVFGKPDFIFPKLKVAVFVDGCFWHCCPLHATQPRHNAAFWQKKLAANIARDRLVKRTLRREGWRVLRLWEHELAWATRKRSPLKSKPSPPAPLPSDGRGWHQALPGRGGEGEARLVARLQRILAPAGEV